MTHEATYERRDNETEPAWELFRAYRDQPSPRSLARLALERGKSRQHLEQLSARHAWVRRVAAYDRYLDACRRREREQAILDMERRHATHLAAAAQALTQPVQALLKRVAEQRGVGAEPFADVSLKDLHRLAVASIRHLPAIVEAERLVAGLSTHNVQADAVLRIDEARHSAERMTRNELEDYLLGVDDGRRDARSRSPAG